MKEGEEMKKTDDRNWKTVSYNGTQQSGPIHAMDALIAELEDQGIEYNAFAWNLWIAEEEQAKVKRTTTKKVADTDLEVRDAQ